MLTCVGRHLHGLDERPSRSYQCHPRDRPEGGAGPR